VQVPADVETKPAVVRRAKGKRAKERENDMARKIYTYEYIYKHIYLYSPCAPLNTSVLARSLVTQPEPGRRHRHFILDRAPERQRKPEVINARVTYLCRNDLSSQRANNPRIVRSRV
jgi:hypothetical protein